MDSQIEFLKNTRKEARRQIGHQSIRESNQEDVNEINPQAIIDKFCNSNYLNSSSDSTRKVDETYQYHQDHLANNISHN